VGDDIKPLTLPVQRMQFHFDDCQLFFANHHQQPLPTGSEFDGLKWVDE